PEPGIGATALRAFDGKPVGWLLWTLPRPGSDLVKILIAPAVVVTLLLLALSIAAARRVQVGRRALLSYTDRLQATSAMLEAAVDAADQGLCVISNGEVKYWNKDFARLMGRPPRALPKDRPGAMGPLIGAGATVLDGDPNALANAL